MKSKFARYENMEDLEKDVSELGSDWALAEWHPCEVTYEQSDGLGRAATWKVVNFYARYVEVNLPVKPMGMKAR